MVFLYAMQFRGTAGMRQTLKNSSVNVVVGVIDLQFDKIVGASHNLSGVGDDVEFFGGVARLFVERSY